MFNTWFSFSSVTSCSTQGNLIKLFYKTNRYGKHSITLSSVGSWNKIQQQLKDMLLKDLSHNEIKTIVSDFYLNHIKNSLIMQKLCVTLLGYK